MANWVGVVEAGQDTMRAEHGKWTVHRYQLLQNELWSEKPVLSETKVALWRDRFDCNT